MESNRNHEYSFLEKTIHRLAFRDLSAQFFLGNVEDRILKRKISEVKVERPLFITGVPRSGTTLLLQLFSRMEEFASHNSGNLPLLLAPLFWNSFTKFFGADIRARERAQGDGVLIDLESAEALDEVLIRYLTQGSDSNYNPLSAKQLSGANRNFLINHIKKMILLEQKRGRKANRYLSKNNSNIARIDLLLNTFPDCLILVPFREPLAQAKSLLQQHRNFSELHQSESFIREYMADIGHYEFGMNLDPINFMNWLDDYKIDANSISFWLDYWHVAYSYLLQFSDNRMIFVSYDDLLSNPRGSLQTLSEVSGLSKKEDFVAAGEQIVFDKKTVEPSQNCPANTRALYRRLLNRACNAAN